MGIGKDAADYSGFDMGLKIINAIFASITRKTHLQSGIPGHGAAANGNRLPLTQPHVAHHIGHSA
jgi:hypothetical protein